VDTKWADHRYVQGHFEILNRAVTVTVLILKTTCNTTGSPKYAGSPILSRFLRKGGIRFTMSHALHPADTSVRARLYRGPRQARFWLAGVACAFSLR
jgi:hypothetical protein